MTKFEIAKKTTAYLVLSPILIPVFLILKPIHLMVCLFEWAMEEVGLD